MGGQLERREDFVHWVWNDERVPDSKSSVEVGTEFFIATETYGGRNHRHNCSLYPIQSSFLIYK